MPEEGTKSQKEKKKELQELKKNPGIKSTSYDKCEK